MSSIKTLWLIGSGLIVAFGATTASAAPHNPVPPAEHRIVHQVRDVHGDGYHRHRHHHGHVHGNPYGRHLDCNWYGDHERCQVHKPRRRHYHYHDDGYRHGYRHRHYYY